METLNDGEVSMWYRNDDGELFYCQSISDAPSEDAALTTNADVADLSLGCAGRPWTEIRSSMDLNGDYVDGNGAPHSINPFTWALVQRHRCSIF